MGVTRRLMLAAVVFMLAGASFATAETFTWGNATVLPVYFQVPGGASIHQAVIDINAGSTNPQSFLLTGPDGTSDLLAAGDVFNTDVSAPYGKNVYLQKVADGHYTLYLSQNNDTQPGVFADSEIWCLTMTDLGGATVIATSLSKNITLEELTTTPALYPNADRWMNNANVTFLFKVPGGASVGIHRVLLKIHADADHSNMKFTIRGPKDHTVGMSGNASDYYIGSDITPPSTDGAELSDLSTGGDRTIKIKNETGIGEYSIKITQDEWQTGRSYFLKDEYWQITVTDLPQTNTLFLETLALDTSDGNLDGSLVKMAHPPIASVLLPANRPPQFPYSVGAGRQFGFQDTGVDVNADYGGLAREWKLDGNTINPAVPRSLADLQSHPLTLKVTETIDPSTAPTSLPASVFPTFTATADDSLSIKVIPVETLTIPWFRSLPREGTPPTIDGNIVFDSTSGFADTISDSRHPDTGWYAGVRLTHGNGTEPADVAFQALRYDAPDKYLYFSFEVRNDGMYNDEDLIVLAFRPLVDASAPATMGVSPITNDLALFIYPVSNGMGALGDRPPRLMQVYKYDGATWQLLSPSPAELDIKVKTYDFSGKTWDVEVKLPMTDAADAIPWVTFGDNFLLYANVVRVSTAALNYAYATQFTWPRSSPSLTGQLSPKLLSPGEWMLATTSSNPRSMARGVYIASALDIGVDVAGVFSNTFELGVDNRVVAKVKNSTVEEVSDGSGGTRPQGKQAPSVIARFRIANWGITPDATNPTPAWADLTPTPASHNPTLPQSVLEPTDTVLPAGDFETPGEELFAFEHNPPGRPGNMRHQCMYVELDSSADAQIITKGIYRNMEFGPASEFSQPASIIAQYDPAPPMGAPSHRFLLMVTQKELDPSKLPRGWSSSPSSVSTAGEPISAYCWVVQGMRDTGRSLIIEKKAFKVAQAVSSFGHVLTHRGALARWRYDIAGATRIAEGIYRVDVPAGRDAQITPTIRAIDQHWQASIHAGAAIPVSTTASSHTTGAAAILDVGYSLNKSFSILGLLGYYGLTGKTGADDVGLIGVSLNARYLYAIRPPFLVFANGGAGWYFPLSGTGGLGFNGGLGAEYAISRAVSAELGCNLHWLTDSDQTKFVTATLGLNVRF